MNQRSKQSEDKDLPEPGPGKQNPKDLDAQLDRALEDTMDASDPPSTIMPEVHHRDESADYDKERKQRQNKS